MTEKILVLGATGYVGGRLVPMLLAKGHGVRVMVRSAEKLRARPWAGHERLEVAEGDVLRRESLDGALEGCSVVYYLVHSMAGGRDFSEADRAGAYNVAEALKDSGVERVIYLSGIIPAHEEETRLSPHLRSRAEVGRILRLAGKPVTILRASQILGVGSASFEVLRYLTEHMPLMIVPAWVNTKTQPISMTNVLGYLTGLLDHPETAGQTYDIGGPDVLSYRDLIEVYAGAAGLRRRRILAVPGIPLGVAAAFVGLITPVPYSLARALVEGLHHEVVCPDTRIRDIIPQALLTVREAVGRALGRVRSRDVDTSWLDAGMPVVPEWVVEGDADYAGGVTYTDAFHARLCATPDRIWPFVERVGGETGWYSRNILWRLRGFMDRVAGGPGVQRGRRSQAELRVGDSLDFWRVLEIRPGERLLLLTEMRLPGEGLLDITLAPAEERGTDAGQSAVDLTDITISLYYRPRGLPGRAYWHLVKPFHSMAFRGMLRALAREAGAPCHTSPGRTRPLPLQH